MDLLTPESLEYVQGTIPKTIAAIRSGDEASRIQTHHLDQIRKDGSIVSVEIVATLLKEEVPGRTEILGVTRDITERKKAAADALKESEERYRCFVESANEAIFVVQEGVIPFCNKKGLDIIGYDAPYLASHSFIDLVHPEDRSAARERHQRRIKGEILDPLGVVRVIDREGISHWLEVNAVIVPWDGRPATLNFATDITERKKADDALMESEKSYHGLFNTIKEAIYIQDSDGRFLNVNDGAVTMYGYPREFFIGKTPEVLSAEGLNDLKKTAPSQ